MNHGDFFKLIRQGIPCDTFLLHGEEEYVKEQAVKLLSESIEADLRPFNVSELEKPSPQELIETCDTLPLFSDKRIVICRELVDGVEPSKYMDCFSDHAPETVLILVFKGKLAANNAVFKFASKRGTEVLFDILSPQECVRWSMKHCGESGVNMPSDVARALVGLVGTDMANLVSETDKLIDYVGPGAAVTMQDISICARTAVDVRIFDMLDMFTYGKTGDGILALHALLDEGNEAMSVASFLAGRFKLMLEARRGIDMKKNKRDVVASMEGNKYANEKAFDAARRFTQEELLSLIGALSDTAYIKISGTMKEEKYLELVLLKHNWRLQPI
ncbi:MAG: DNA polymerase III subunit delta [Clostridia bacterium]|nr:DNA polymerase III subunit delta [Clostridia bacterium]